MKTTPHSLELRFSLVTHGRAITDARGSDFRRAALGDKFIRFFRARLHRIFKIVN